MTIVPGEFWIADIPYTDRTGSKIRPVLVLWLDGNDAVVAAITSYPPRTSTDVALVDWRAGGLRLPSTVRLSRLDCLEHTLLLHRIGAVAPADAGSIKIAWNQFVKPQF